MTFSLDIQKLRPSLSRTFRGFVDDPHGPRLHVWLSVSLAASAVNSHCSESVSIWQFHWRAMASRAAG